MRKNVKVTLSTGWLLLCLAAMPVCIFGQNQPGAPPPAGSPSTATPTAPSATPAPDAPQAPEPAPTPAPSVLAPPKYTLNNVNNGMGLSIEPILFQPYGHPTLHTGDYNNTLTPGNLAYPGNPDHSFTGNIVVPAGKGSYDIQLQLFPDDRHRCHPRLSQESELFWQPCQPGRPARHPGQGHVL